MKPRYYCHYAMSKEESKKYYAMGEVSRILQIPAYQLRYLEKIIPNFTVTKIKGRRYYTKQNVELIKTKINKVEFTTSSAAHETTLIINQINALIFRFQEYSFNLQRLLNK